MCSAQTKLGDVCELACPILVGIILVLFKTGDCWTFEAH